MGNKMGCGSSTEASSPGKKQKSPSANGTSGGFRPGRDPKDVEPIELTESVVDDYIALEKDIYRLERKNVLKKYELKMVYADELKKTVDQLEATHKELKKQTEKEKADVDNIEQPSVRAFLKQQGTWEQKWNKEQEEYVQALNKQEIAQKELFGAKKLYEKAARIADIYKSRSDRLNDQYDKQDRMLAGIFGGEYGSDLENTLEAQLDQHLEWQQRVSLAKFKWTNGRVLLVHACTQMAFGVTRWRELQQIDSGNTRMRYFAAAEARNNFIAASQNVQSCRVYLGKVKFPYCTEEEMKHLEETVNSAFTDIQQNSTYNKALGVYQNIHKKVAALIQWFDQVINETILKDLEKANADVSKVQKELRTERLRLINDKVREKLGHDIHIEHGDVSDDEDDEELLALEADKVTDAKELPGSDLNNLLNLSRPDGRMPTPLPTSQLAPMPSKDALFGDVQKTMKDHQQQKKEIANRHDALRSKQDMALQEQLRMRKEMADAAKGKSTNKKRRSHRQRRQSVHPGAMDADGLVNVE